MNNERVRPIPQDIIDKVRARANIADVLRSMGVELMRDGHDGEWKAFSPFRQDKHMGSFKVSERKGICYDFATNESWDSIEAVMVLEGKTFNESVRMMASMYGIFVDDTPAPKVKKLKPREQVPELPILYRHIDTTNVYMGHEDENPLLRWMKSLPLNQKMLRWAIAAYRVGTAQKGKYQGWTVWWNMNELGYVQTGKLMAYCEDGHRDKTTDENGREKTTWAHALWARAGMYDTKTHRAVTGTFGLHLLSVYPDAQVAVVESEKTAVICSTLCDPNTKIWIATGGIGSLRARIERPMKMGRELVLYPDKDGYEKWKAEAEKLNYQNMVVMTPEQQGWTEADGPKADVADIVVRQITRESVGQRVATLCGMPEKAEALDDMINQLNLIET